MNGNKKPVKWMGWRKLGTAAVKVNGGPGLKFDGEKIPLQLIPGNALLEVGKVLRYGAGKYAAHNWRNGLAYSRLMGACLRHATAFNEGEDLDPETQLSHIAHLACEALFLLEFVTKDRTDLDDRYKPTPPRKGRRKRSLGGTLPIEKARATPSHKLGKSLPRKGRK